MEEFTGFVKQYKKKIITVVVVLFVILIMSSCYEKWNEMWYDVGKNIYYLFH